MLIQVPFACVINIVSAVWQMGRATRQHLAVRVVSKHAGFLPKQPSLQFPGFVLCWWQQLTRAAAVAAAVLHIGL